MTWANNTVPFPLSHAPWPFLGSRMVRSGGTKEEGVFGVNGYTSANRPSSVPQTATTRLPSSDRSVESMYPGCAFAASSAGPRSCRMRWGSGPLSVPSAHLCIMSALWPKKDRPASFPSACHRSPNVEPTSR